VILKQNNILRPKGHVDKVSNFLFMFIVHITMIVLLSPKTKANKLNLWIFAYPTAQKIIKILHSFDYNFNHKKWVENGYLNLWRVECVINARLVADFHTGFRQKNTCQ